MINGSSKQGTLIWITGLPGAGKTVFADKLADECKDHLPVIRIDGDIVREITGNDLGYTIEDRKKNAYRIVRLNKYLVEQGLTVICSTVSLYREIHQWNREHIESLIEVFIDVPYDVLCARDKKGLYTKVDCDVIGIHQDYDIPETPSCIIKNAGDERSFLDQTYNILQLIKNRAV